MIPAGKCVVYFHSDSSDNDWGFRFTARARTVSVEKPPPIPPSRRELLGAALRFHALRAVSSLLDSTEGESPAQFAELSPAFVNLAVRGMRDMDDAGGESKGTPVVLESKHPYDNSDERYIPVNVPGASKLLVSFDPRTRSERNCDYMVFYKDDSHSDVWGESK